MEVRKVWGCRQEDQGRGKSNHEVIQSGQIRTDDLLIWDFPVLELLEPRDLSAKDSSWVFLAWPEPWEEMNNRGLCPWCWFERSSRHLLKALLCSYLSFQDWHRINQSSITLRIARGSESWDVIKDVSALCAWLHLFSDLPGHCCFDRVLLARQIEKGLILREWRALTQSLF